MFSKLIYLSFLVLFSCVCPPADKPCLPPSIVLHQKVLKHGKDRRKRLPNNAINIHCNDKRQKSWCTYDYYAAVDVCREKGTVNAEAE